MSASLSDSVVLGAGLMGRLLALELAHRGQRVEVHEVGTPAAEGSAARAAAAMLAPLAESAITELSVVRMGVHALGRWPELLRRLPVPVFFQQQGTVIVWHRQDAAEARRFAGLIARTATALPDLPAPREIDGASLGRMEPALDGRFPRALHLPGEGQLDNRGLLEALRLALDAHPRVTMHWGSARALEDFRSPPGGPAADGPWLFDCRGLGARTQWKALRGVRGEVVRLHAPDVGLLRPTRLIHPRYPIYIAPKPEGLYVIGATEIETEDLSPASVRSTLELLSAAYTVHPAFAEGRIVEISTQARPTLPDNLPAVEVTGPRRLRLNGLYRHGYLIAPAVLDAVLEWVSAGRAALAQALGLRFEHAQAVDAGRVVTPSPTM
jgi:glycine oxidase